MEHAKHKAVCPDTVGFGLGWRLEAVCEKQKSVRPDSLGFASYSIFIFRDLTLIDLHLSRLLGSWGCWGLYWRSK